MSTPEVQPPRPRPAARPDPRRRQRAVRRARLRRGLDRGHRERRRRHPRARAPLLRRSQGRLHRPAGAPRRPARGTTPAARGPQRPGARGRHRVALARLDRSQPHDLARHDRARRRHRRPRRQASGRRPRAPRRRAARTFHADIAEDTPRLRYALECWTGLNRAATRRWLRGEATREATHELLASTLEHVLRTFGAPPVPRRAHLLPEIRTVEFHASQRRRCRPPRPSAAPPAAGSERTACTD